MNKKPSEFYNNSVFWIEVDKIRPNPLQPRKEFDESGLRSLADSIRQYGVLQALVVTRKEIPRPDGGLAVEYELIAGERRLRASKIAGLFQVPVLIRTSEDTDLMKLELAIIENVQREDLKPVDRARAFNRLVTEFKFQHNQIADKIGKSREYVSNSLRILSLPDYILDALNEGKISEGHTRPLMMLSDRTAEQDTLLKEIISRKLSVRESESIARRIASDRIRKRILSPELKALEQELSEKFGTRVRIDKGEKGGKISIDFFSEDDFNSILGLIQQERDLREGEESSTEESGQSDSLLESQEQNAEGLDDRSKEEKEDEDLYFIKNFSI